MDVLTNISTVLVELIDVLLGWMLVLPRDVALLMFAVVTALLMIAARRLLTDQDLMRRCTADLRRLKQLMREARHSNDRSAVSRMRVTIGQIKGLQLAADLRVLAGVIVPVGVLAIWATERFEFMPLQLADDIVVRVHYPNSSIDRITHLVPQPAWEMKSTPVQIVRPDPEDTTAGIAEWTLRANQPGEQALTIRHQGESVTHRLRVGQPTYLARQQPQAAMRMSSSEVKLRRYLPLGSSLGGEFIGLPPWMIGYLILALLLMPVLKRILRVA